MICIRNVSYRYPSSATLALHDINLDIHEGDTLGLLGPNGAGKTTLMSLLAGLQAVQQGEITFNGVSSKKLSPSQRHRISLVPQDFAFYPALSVWDNLQYFSSLYHIRDKAWLQQLITQTNLDAHRKKLAKHLSGGLKRRLNFAIGLINRPTLIFLDEITVGIDPESRQFILESVAKLSHDGVTVIYTSHYLQEIEQLCPNIALLANGQLIHQGKIADILAQQSPQQWYIRTNPPLSSEHLALLSARLDHDGTAIISNMTIDTLSAFLHQHRYSLTTCRFGHLSLEQFYLDFLHHHSC